MRYILLLFTASLLYAQLAVIAPKSLPLESLSLSEIQYLYLGKTDTIQGVKLMPKDNEKPEIFNEFCKIALEKSAHQLRSYWARMIFTGQQKPPETTSYDKLKQELTKIPPTITYVEQGNVPQGWKVLYKIDR